MGEYQLTIGIIILTVIASLILGRPVEVPTEVIDECFARLQRHNQVLDIPDDNAASGSGSSDANRLDD